MKVIVVQRAPLLILKHLTREQFYLTRRFRYASQYYFLELLLSPIPILLPQGLVLLPIEPFLGQAVTPLLLPLLVQILQSVVEAQVILLAAPD